MLETTKLHPKQPVAAALASRAAVRPALRQGGAFALGLSLIHISEPTRP